MFHNKNDKILSQNYYPQNWFLNEKLKNPTVYKWLGKVECMTFSYLKISVYSTTNSTIKVKFSPNYVHRTFTASHNTDLTTRPTTGITETPMPDSFFRVQEIDIPINQYIFICLPIEGEIVDIAIKNSDSNGVCSYIRAMLTKENNNISNN
tara:strand:- start:48 stop:500 length:453 start_codon:yes stop_codon:yes gene_type:complete